ncbi:MAG TPA: SBBP repeat-containing protein [bacterium]|nr:SBBP repeat-containing protein [bacterium]
MKKALVSSLCIGAVIAVPVVLFAQNVTLEYSTYLGGTNTDEGNALAVDSALCAYVVGYTYSNNFPTFNSYQANFGGNYDVFITRFSSAGSSVLYSTFIGGANSDTGYGVAVNSAFEAVVTGYTYSTDFPTVNPYQASRNAEWDFFVVMLSSTGSSLIYSTYLGGNGNDYGRAVALDTDSNAYITGWSLSSDFPTVNPCQAYYAGYRDVTVSKLSSTGSELLYSTYCGGFDDDQGYAIAVDGDGEAWVGGSTESGFYPYLFPTVNAYQSSFGGGSCDAFLFRLSSDGARLLYSTYFGGNGDDYAYAVGLAPDGGACLVGKASSTNFPTVNPFQASRASSSGDAFAARFAPGGSSLVYSTYIGGVDGSSQFQGIGVDGQGGVFAGGYTYAESFPTVRPYQAGMLSTNDVIITRFSPSGSSLVYSTFLGGTHNDYAYGFAIDANQDAYITGYTNAVDFPTVNPYQASRAGSEEVFVTKLKHFTTPSATPTPVGYKTPTPPPTPPPPTPTPPSSMTPSPTPEGYLTPTPSPTPMVLVFEIGTYLGGASDDYSYDVSVDSLGDFYVVGYTYSDDFPTVNPYQAARTGADAFLTKFSSDGSTLLYSTYLGGSSYDYCYGMAVDTTLSAYLTGRTRSTDFPTVNAYQASLAGSNYNAFVTRFSSDGSELLYSSYLGGGDVDYGNEIVVDSAFSAYVHGYTNSTDFPTVNPYQASRYGSNEDGFVTKFSSDGFTLLYSTYLGGGGEDYGYGIDVDSLGCAFVTGYTDSTTFPTVNPYQPSRAGDDDAYVAKLSSTGSELLYSTYLGGSDTDRAYAVAVDSLGSAYVTGRTQSAAPGNLFPVVNAYQDIPHGETDVFVAKLGSTGSTLVYSTYLGGADDDYGEAIAIDSQGAASVTGRTESDASPFFFPVTADAYQPAPHGDVDAFVATISADGSRLDYSTYLGGSGPDSGYGIACSVGSPLVRIYATGRTESNNFPTLNAYQPSRGGSTDVYVFTLVKQTTPTPTPSATPTPSRHPRPLLPPLPASRPLRRSRRRPRSPPHPPPPRRRPPHPPHPPPPLPRIHPVHRLPRPPLPAPAPHPPSPPPPP